MHIFLEYSNKEPLFITNANYLFRPMNNCIIMKIHPKNYSYSIARNSIQMIMTFPNSEKYN